MRFLSLFLMCGLYWAINAPAYVPFYSFHFRFFVNKKGPDQVAASSKDGRRMVGFASALAGLIGEVRGLVSIVYAVVPEDWLPE